jgi:hypothetical protein
MVNLVLCFCGLIYGPEIVGFRAMGNCADQPEGIVSLLDQVGTMSLKTVKVLAVLDPG